MLGGIWPLMTTLESGDKQPAVQIQPEAIWAKSCRISLRVTSQLKSTPIFDTMVVLLRASYQEAEM
jgi:hypothetical protein